MSDKGFPAIRLIIARRDFGVIEYTNSQLEIRIFLIFRRSTQSSTLDKRWARHPAFIDRTRTSRPLSASSEYVHRIHEPRRLLLQALRRRRALFDERRVLLRDVVQVHDRL
ncbi:hypothetical protein, partial [Burkholderia cenocepacia]